MKFIEKANEYFRSQGQNYEAAEWLMLNSNEMQSFLGSKGVLDSFQHPYSNRIDRNYKVILDTISEIRREFNSAPYSRDTRAVHAYNTLLQESILNYIDILNDISEFEQRTLRNPFMWLKTGIQYVLIFPLNLLFWFGIISDLVLIRVIHNSLFKSILQITFFLAILSGIIAIVTGWS